jgi:release factor glutamine methyltransferase
MRSAAGSSSRPLPDGGATAAFADGPSVRMALAVATADLREAGCETARLDAELLLAEALATGRTALHLHPERVLTIAESDRFAPAVPSGTSSWRSTGAC